jgi:predicted small lipoprotein YifL
MEARLPETPMPCRLPVLSLTILAALALGVAACGRKGSLEPPPEQELLVRQGAKVEDGVIKPRQSFPLDPLLN